MEYKRQGEKSQTQYSKEGIKQVNNVTPPCSWVLGFAFLSSYQQIEMGGAANSDVFLLVMLGLDYLDSGSLSLP